MIEKTISGHRIIMQKLRKQGMTYQSISSYLKKNHKLAYSSSAVCYHLLSDKRRKEINKKSYKPRDVERELVKLKEDNEYMEKCYKEAVTQKRSKPEEMLAEHWHELARVGVSGYGY